MYYIKSFNKKKRKFSFVSTPFFEGNVIFGLDIKEKMRPLSFNKIQKNTAIDPIDPRLFNKFLLSGENQFIAFSNQSRPEELSPIFQMLENFQVNEERIIKLTMCHSCIEINRFTLLEDRNTAISYKNSKICIDCALKIVLSQASSIGLVPRENISPKLKNFFIHMLHRHKDVKKIIKSFTPSFDPTTNKANTLYDIEINPPISRKYLDYRMDHLNLPKEFKEVLLNDNKIVKLLPIQALSVENGLLSSKKNQLIMAPTSGGKTLIGELSGISTVLEDKNLKMLYLVPIVALANIRTDEFYKKYKRLNLKIIKRIGESILNKNHLDNIEELNDANIVVATFEAIDFILRSGNLQKLGNIGTIIIDEIQTLIEPERGFLLDGFIARLKSVFPEAQFLYLSATIGEPHVLARKLDCSLIRYNNRPVPIERHILLCLNELQKEKFIANLVSASFSQKSKFGFRGQSIIFTNTRKRCEAIAQNLEFKGIKVRAYHSGLTNEERKNVELEFQTQKIAGVVATAALAAGVDLPAQQVLFESLAMGIKWLTVAEFEQMLGRAGRLRKHEIGYVYLLIEPGKIYSPKMKMTEENIAISLLNGKIKDFELAPDEDKSITELLAFISTYQGVNKEKIYDFYKFLINNDYDLENLLKKLDNNKLIRVKENLTYQATGLGRAIAKSFLTVEKGLEVIDAIEKDKNKSLIELALELNPLKNVYLTKRIVSDISRDRSMKYLSNNLFTTSTLSLLDADNVKKKSSYSRAFIETMMKWLKDIFNCDCKDKPYCECGRIKIENLILSLRIKEKQSIVDICQYLEEEYEIVVFKGDIIDFLESFIYSIESIVEIVNSLNNLDPNYRQQLSEIMVMIEDVKQ